MNTEQLHTPPVLRTTYELDAVCTANWFFVMKKTVSIKENKDFKRLYYRGKSVANDILVVYYRQNPYPHCRLGLTVSGKVGKAVVRNRVRRLIKESYRLMEDRVRKSMDIVVVARTKAAAADFKTVSAALEKAFVKSGIIKNDVKNDK